MGDTVNISFTSNGVYLGICGTGDASALSLHSRIYSGDLLVLGYLLVFLLMRGSEIKNDLCHHLGILTCLQLLFTHFFILE